jgi:hypothetical protein
MKSPSTTWEEGVYYAALKIGDPARRDAFLDQACAGDAHMRATVDQLLSARAEAERFFTRSSSALQLSAESFHSANGRPALAGDDRVKLPDDEKPGARIGRYRLAQKIGEGGCGTVYQAEQEEPVRRNVALKIIKLGMDTKSVIARFGAERQALALMDHPNIARALDAGATDKGRPFFVMELVRGVKITAYCDQQNLDIRRRLDLFIQICHAIQHAHQKGIIHRDIKPSNILVTSVDGAPMPKVIDFGIAKAITGERLANNTVFTACEQFMGTPAYMSPEQAQMGRMDIDTRSDIYSLGVLLYELLTGKTPFDPNVLINSGMDELRRTLREVEPPRPSAMLAGLSAVELAAVARHRAMEPSRLSGLLRGDLDWIVMKTQEKDRARRYETANGLALDIQHYLNSEPIQARPPSRLYQFRKLVRRNRAPFAAVAVVTLTLCLGLGASTWEFFQERAARRETEREKAVEVELLAKDLDLREKNDARQNMSSAAIAVSHGEFAEADELVKRIPIAYFFPSLEAAEVFRKIGEWHVLHGRWKEASYQFAGLLQVSQFEKDKSDNATRDLLQAAPLLLEIGDREGYEHFRAESLRRFASTANPLAAERIVRASLLAPANKSTLGSLASLAQVVEKSLGASPADGASDTNLFGPEARWGPVSLALWQYRQAHWDVAVERGSPLMASGDKNPARMAAARLILAMAHFRLGRHNEAAAELAQSRTTIDAKFRAGLKSGDDTEGYWFDWGMARILLREAAGLIEGESQGAKPALAFF